MVNLLDPRREARPAPRLGCDACWLPYGALRVSPPPGSALAFTVAAARLLAHTLPFGRGGVAHVYGVAPEAGDAGR